MNARASVQIGTIAGIPLRVHVSWLVALFLMTSSLSIQLGDSAGAFAPFVALATAITLFAALVAHELGHALVARRCGVGVSAITLFVFGGVATLESEPRRPRDELAIAAMGPFVSLSIAALAWSATLVPLPFGMPPIVIEPLLWLARVNLGIAIFNLVPGFPLDGGRILRAAIWAVRRDALRATASAAKVGRGIAYGMMSVGVARTLLGWTADGVWICLVGWFLLSAARAAVESLPTIAASVTLAAYVRHVAATGDRRPYVVVDHERPCGAITIERVFSVPAERWPSLTVGEVGAGPWANERPA